MSTQPIAGGKLDGAYLRGVDSVSETGRERRRRRGRGGEGGREKGGEGRREGREEVKKERKKEWKSPPLFPHHRAEAAQEKEGCRVRGCSEAPHPGPTFCLYLGHRLTCPADECHCNKHKQGTESPLLVPTEPSHADSAGPV